MGMMRFKENGYAIRCGRSFYEMNGIGDWSLAGDIDHCLVFPTREGAQEVIDEHIEAEDVEIVALSRSIQVKT